jgi:hypothetical protein
MSLLDHSKRLAHESLAWMAFAKFQWTSAMAWLAKDVEDFAKNYESIKQATQENIAQKSTTGALEAFGRLVAKRGSKLGARRAGAVKALDRAHRGRLGALNALIEKPKLARSAQGVRLFDQAATTPGFERVDDAMLGLLWQMLSEAPAQAWRRRSSIEEPFFDRHSMADLAGAAVLSRAPSPQSVALMRALVQSQGLSLSSVSAWVYGVNGMALGRTKSGSSTAIDLMEPISWEVQPGWGAELLRLAMESGNASWEALCLGGALRQQPSLPLPEEALGHPLALPIALLVGDAAQTERALKHVRAPDILPSGALAALSSRDALDKIQLLADAGVDVFEGPDWEKTLSRPEEYLNLGLVCAPELLRACALLDPDWGKEGPQGACQALIEAVDALGGAQELAERPCLDLWSRTLARHAAQPWEPTGGAGQVRPALWPTRALRAGAIFFSQGNFEGLAALAALDQSKLKALEPQAFFARPWFSLQALDAARACGWSPDPAPWWIQEAGYVRTNDPFKADESTADQLLRCDKEGWLDDPATREKVVRIVVGGNPDRFRAAKWLLEWGGEDFDGSQRERLELFWRWGASELGADADDWADDGVRSWIQNRRGALDLLHELDDSIAPVHSVKVKARL